MKRVLKKGLKPMFRLAIATAALLALGGCVVAPAPYGYPAYGYAPAPAYVAPAPVVVGVGGGWGWGWHGGYHHW
jgi:hypothetical protein